MVESMNLETVIIDLIMATTSPKKKGYSAVTFYSEELFYMTIWRMTNNLTKNLVQLVPFGELEINSTVLVTFYFSMRKGKDDGNQAFPAVEEEIDIHV